MRPPKLESFYKQSDELTVIFQTLFHEGKISKGTYDNLISRLKNMDTNLPNGDDFLKELLSKLTKTDSLPRPAFTNNITQKPGYYGQIGNSYITIENY